MKPGLFITFEGVEGCGKSTQVERLRQRLTTMGYKVIATREPGGTPIAEAIRAILLDPQHAAMCPTAELLLYEAARAQHVAEKILPALQAGAIVLCDRFSDSTTAYQGAGRGLSPEDVAPLHAIATAGLNPDKTILVDVPAEVGLARVMKTKTRDRIELEAIEFHTKVRDGFLAIAKAEPNRVAIVDGTQPLELVSTAVDAIIDSLLEAL